jgi:hypothetical protein
MTEPEWEACGDIRLMADFILATASDRKLRLFACACARTFWDFLTDWRSRQAVEVAERFVDGLCAPEELAQAQALSGKAPAKAGRAQLIQEIPFYAAAPAQGLPMELPAGTGSGAYAAWLTARRFRSIVKASEQGGCAEERRACGIMRDVVANPFRPVAFDPAWRTPTVVALAEAAYEWRLLPSGELEPQRLAVLADALEEAGAGDELLAHLRGPGPHVRGCFAVDLLTGRFADSPRSA